MKLKQDKYRRARGGHARLLKLNCAGCNTPLLSYQKDGPGILKRLYIDRMDPAIPGQKLVCKKCKELLGVRIIYKKESRPAFRLFAGSIVKAK